MNLDSYNLAHPPKAFLDTTVLCGAIRTNGINRQLVFLAADTTFFTPVVSRVCLLEFYRRALSSGIGGVTYTYKEVTEFLDLSVYPCLENQPAVNSIVGRESLEVIIRSQKSIGEVLVELSGCTDEQAKRIAEQQQMSEPLYQFDLNDFHVWVTAIQQKCDIIVSENRRRFPEKIGNIVRMGALGFYKYLDLG